MKSSDIKAGVKATTKISGRDHVVTVIGESLGKGGATQWIVRTPAGNQVYRTARQLRALECMGHDSAAEPGCDGYPRTVYCDGSCQARKAAGILAIEARRINRPWETRATAADGIDAIEDRAHERAMRQSGPGNCSGCGHPHGGPDCAVF